MPQIIQENPESFLNILFRELSKSWKSNIWNLWKDRRRKCRRPISWPLKNIGYGRNMFQNTWNGMLVICNKCFPTKTLNAFWNFEILKTRNQETKKQILHETKTLWNQQTKKTRTTKNKNTQKSLSIAYQVCVGGGALEATQHLEKLDDAWRHSRDDNVQFLPI